MEKSRLAIAAKVRALRQGRRWTQAELSKRLGLSQARLSEIERGGGSFSAEQFLEILKLFNVVPGDFVPAAASQGAALQNALARLGALHLVENDKALPSERLTEVGDAIRETLVSAESPRLIAALAPVLVRNIEHVNLTKLHAQLAALGFERRLAWLAENTLEALQLNATDALPRREAQLQRRAEVVLRAYVGFIGKPTLGAVQRNLDVLDAGIRSKQSLDEVAGSSSDIARAWGIISALQPADFASALRATHATR